MKINPASLSICLGIAIVAPSAGAQPQGYKWQGFLLHPPGAYASNATALDGKRACGDAFGDPAIWTGRDAEYLSLLPQGASKAFVEAAGDGVQTGDAVWSLQEAYPALWRGSAESFVNLEPPGPYWKGDAAGHCGSQTVGLVISTITGQHHAALWLNGDPAQFIDLHPASADWSEAYATDGVWQGGCVVARAALWKGSAGSFVDMHPAGKTQSVILGMAPGTQVGNFIKGNYHAVLWHDTPESWKDMTPAGATSAQLYATTGTYHVGYANAPGVPAHARLWLSDDPEDNLDLHAFTPPEFAENGSEARAISVVDGVISIAGSVNAPRAHAFLWVGTPIDSTDHAQRKKPQKIGRKP
ncbi:MAG: hypothetical protein IPJ41_00950 [Phycisphaerales bacterium]|nr:hypothetical protein [Phycisphaerales bacterium]